MWTAEITDISFTGSVFTVTVYYTAPVGSTAGSFGEVMDVTGGTPDVVNQKITTRLSTINANESLCRSIVRGPVTPASSTLTPDNALLAAKNNLATLKQDVDLGILAATDQIYIDALSAAQVAYTAASSSISEQTIVTKSLTV